MIMPHQRIDHILQCAVIRIADLGTDYLAQFVLECFPAACFHLPFGKGLFVLMLSRIVIIKILPDRMLKSSLDTLCSEEFTHFPQISFVASECSARFNMAVAYKEMNVLMGSVSMDCEQYLIAPKESLSKLLCNSECLLVSQFVIVFRRKGNGDFIGKICIPDRLLPEQLSCHENIAGEMVAVAVETPVEVGFGFYHAVPYLLFLPTEQIVGGAVKLCG